MHFPATDSICGNLLAISSKEPQVPKDPAIALSMKQADTASTWDTGGTLNGLKIKKTTLKIIYTDENGKLVSINTLEYASLIIN